MININRTMTGRTTRADQRGVYADVPGVNVETAVYSPALAELLPTGDAKAAFAGADLSGATVRQRVASSEGEAFQVSRTTFPADVVAAAPQIAEQDTGAGGFLSRLEDAGWVLDQAAVLSFAVAAGDPVSTRLDVPVDGPLSREIWTVTDRKSGKVLAVTESFYPAAAVSFSYA